MKEQIAEEKTLAHKMRDRALQLQRLDPDVSRLLLEHADALDALNINTPIPQVVGTWAKARRFWSELTGEPLV